MALDIELTPEVLRQLLAYDPSSGVLTWRRRDRAFFKTDHEHRRGNARYAGDQAMRLKPNGYLSGFVMRQMNRAHRVVWAIHHGAWPVDPMMIDHIDGNRANNRIDNLRLVTKRENCRNMKRSVKNLSGATGVCNHGKRWRAQIRDGNRQIHLGVFDTVEEASAARKRAESELGYHENHGRPSLPDC